MITESEINKVIPERNGRARDIIAFIAENEWCTTLEIAKDCSYDRAAALRCIKQATSEFKCNIVYKTNCKPVGGVIYRYKLTGIGKGSLKCVDKEMERNYSVSDLHRFKTVRTSNTAIETIEVLDSQTEYLTIEELAEIAMTDYSIFHSRLQTLEKRYEGMFIHRIGPIQERRLKLISLSHLKKKREYQEAVQDVEINKSQSLLNSAFR